MTRKIDEWLCERRLVGDKVTCIYRDHRESSGLYQCFTGYFCGNTYVNNYPQYYVWKDDVLVKITSNYTDAYNLWFNRTDTNTFRLAPVPMVG